MNHYSIFTEEEIEEVIEDKTKYKINNYLQDNLQMKYIHDQLAKPEVRNKIVESLGEYIDKHNEALGAPGPMYQMPFGEKDEEFLYEIFGLTPDLLKEIFQQMNIETFNGKIAKMFTSFVRIAPAKIMVIAMLIDALQNNYEDMADCAKYILSFIEYPLLFKKSFQFGVKPDVMLATLEDLPKRFHISKFNNVQQWLKNDMDNLVTSFYNKLISGQDHIYTLFMQYLRNWLKSKFKNIADEYYKHNDENITQHNQVTVFDDGSINDQSGTNTTIMQISTSTINKFTNKEISDSIIKAVCEYPKVDADLVKNYINKIYNNPDNKIAQFIEAVITAYFTKYPTEIKLNKGQFISFGLMLYRSISTSKKEVYMTIKSVLDYWINNICDIDSYTSRAATKINYTRAIFNYMIFMIANYN